MKKIDGVKTIFWEHRVHQLLSSRSTNHLWVSKYGQVFCDPKITAGIANKEQDQVWHLEHLHRWVTYHFIQTKRLV